MKREEANRRILDLICVKSNLREDKVVQGKYGRAVWGEDVGTIDENKFRANKKSNLIQISQGVGEYKKMKDNLRNVGYGLLTAEIMWRLTRYAAQAPFLGVSRDYTRKA